MYKVNLNVNSNTATPYYNIAIMNLLITGFRKTEMRQLH